jgi:NAD(P)-dependent dehydrogenase (short-subunit alcohol dehydrogenase family)
MPGSITLITGAGGGIGSAVARRLAALGRNVLLFGRSSGPLDRLRSELGDRAQIVVGDATSESDLAGAVATACEHFGEIDGLVHCVGSIHLKPLHLTSPEEFSRTVSTNLTSAYLACRAVIPEMRKAKSGSIVLVSTVAARQGLNNHEVIAAAKGGIEAMVRSAAITYARFNIRFNAVAPGMTETPLTAPLLTSDANRKFSEAIHPLGRLGQPAEIAAAVTFLLGDEASWITGQVLGVDGGLAAGVLPPRMTINP